MKVSPQEIIDANVQSLIKDKTAKITLMPATITPASTEEHAHRRLLIRQDVFAQLLIRAPIAKKSSIVVQLFAATVARAFPAAQATAVRVSLVTAVPLVKFSLNVIPTHVQMAEHALKIPWNSPVPVQRGIVVKHVKLETDVIQIHVTMMGNVKLKDWILHALVHNVGLARHVKCCPITMLVHQEGRVQRQNGGVVQMEEHQHKDLDSQDAQNVFEKGPRLLADLD